MSSPGHAWTKHEREGWSVCSRCGMVRNYDRETTTCSGALPKIRQRSEIEDRGQDGACKLSPGCNRHDCDAEKARIVDEWKAANGYNDLLAAYSVAVDEAGLLRKLFDDAGEGQYNVLNLVESYQRNLMDADERLRAVRKLLEWNGCDCDCEHHHEDHDDDCDRCLACLISEAVGT